MFEFLKNIMKNEDSTDVTNHLNSVPRILKTDFKNQFEIFHLQSKNENQKYLTNKLDDLENLSSSINDHFYHPRNKKL